MILIYTIFLYYKAPAKFLSDLLQGTFLCYLFIMYYSHMSISLRISAMVLSTGYPNKSPVTASSSRPMQS